MSHLWSRPPNSPEREKTMSRDADALHVWKLKESSWLLKFYYFWYPWNDKSEQSYNPPNFCKISWAVIFAIPMIVGWVLLGILSAVIMPFVWFKERRDNNKFTRLERKAKSKEARAERKSAKKETVAKIPAWGSQKIDAIVTFFQKHRWVASTIGKGVIVIIGAVVLFFTWMGAWWIVVTLDHNWVWSLFWEVIGGIVGAGVLIGILIGVGTLLDRTGWGSKAGNAVYDSVLTPVGHGFRKIGWSFASCGSFIGMVVHAVKTHTCPRVEIVKG